MVGRPRSAKRAASRTTLLFRPSDRQPTQLVRPPHDRTEADLFARQLAGRRDRGGFRRLRGARAAVRRDTYYSRNRPSEHAGENIRDSDDPRNDFEQAVRETERARSEVPAELAFTPAEPVTWKAVYLCHNQRFFPRLCQELGSCCNKCGAPQSTSGSSSSSSSWEDFFSP